jgi:hypothetical protein
MKKIHGQYIMAIIIKINLVEFFVNEVRNGNREKRNSTVW